MNDDIANNRLPTLAMGAAAGALGGFAVAGWAPLAWWPVVLLCHACLAWMLAGTRSPAQAGLVGLAFGCGIQFLGHGWLSEAARQAGLPPFAAVVSAHGLLLFLALFSALPCLIWRRMLAGLPTASAAVALGALLTASEWGRSLVLNGLTSLSLGYALVDSPLAGYAPVLGNYGLSFLAYLISSGVGLAFARPDWRVLRSTIAAAVAVFAVGSGLTRIEWVEPQGQVLSYRLLQADVAQELKFDPAYVRRQIQRYLDVIEAQSADIVLTPETAFPVFLNELPAGALERLRTFAGRSRSHLLLGAALNGPGQEAFNALVLVAPDTRELAYYRKVKLMPFGEYSPLGLGWFTRSLRVALQDLSPGEWDQPPLAVGPHKVGVLICLEDTVGANLHRWLPEATLLVNPSNLAWFGAGWATEQNLQMVRLRAMEAGRPILRAANTGVTAHIDHRGHVVARLPTGAEGVLQGRVQPMSGSTPYARWGDLPVLTVCLLGVVGLRARRGRARLHDDFCDLAHRL